jgi:glycosyltransferase involved in cell wall biosynthesis
VLQHSRFMGCSGPHAPEVGVLWSRAVRHLLVVAYVFPPLGGGGVQRTLGFVRHLLDRGWRSIVITAGDDSKYWARDPTLLAHVPGEIEVHRVPEGIVGTAAQWARRAVPRSIRPAFDRALFVPDRNATWWPSAVRRALALLSARSIDAIYSTSGPWTDHLVAMAASARSRVPWVADFRDPWTLSHFFSAATPLHAAAHRALEREVYERADRIVVNTKTHLDQVLASFPVARGKALHLPNGWDPEELADLPAHAPGQGRRSEKRIVYAGSFYPGRGPERFYALLEEAFRLQPELRSRIAVDLYGKTEGARVPASLADRVVEHGYVSQREANEALARADATLIVMPEGESSGFVPGKLFTQLFVGRPILAVTPPGDTAELVREAGGGSLVMEPESSIDLLVAWLDALVHDRLPAGFAPEVVARYDRRRLAGRLAEELDAIVRRP